MNASSSITSSGWLLRRADERFHSKLDWLDSRHSFSFAGHHHPDWMGFGPLRVINDDTIAAGAGFGMHPHRNMEIVTVMVSGELCHQDSMGHQQRLRAGEVQRMSTGRGLVHSERNGGPAACRLLQIWIEPTEPGGEPAYEQKPFAIGHRWCPLIAPDRAEGAMAIRRPVRLWRALPGAGERLELPVPPGQLGWLQLVEGVVETDRGPGRLETGDGLGFDPAAPGSPTSLTAGDQGADLLLFALA